MRYTGAQIIIKLLERYGIRIIAGIPGGANLPLYNALYESKIRHILVRHEQAAGFIAQGMARSTGKPSVCFATSGPGVTNLLTAIADAKLDSIPIIAITGQVPTALIGTDAFQEVDTYGMTIPITKHNFLVKNSRELLTIIPEAFNIATSGRPGPVAIDVPKDVQNEQIEFDTWPKAALPTQNCKINDLSAKEIAQTINESKKPLMYIGGGIIASGAQDLVFRLAKKNSIPVALTLTGLGSFPADNELYLGMLGMHGASYTNFIVEEADLILAFGVRFDDRATGLSQKFCRNAKIIHIDIDNAEINKIKKAHLSLCADINQALKIVIPLVHRNDRKDWLSQIGNKKKKYSIFTSKDPLHPINIIKAISGMVFPDTIITTDVGQHQMWVAQSYPFKKPRTLLTSGGLGTMGFGLPAAIGAALANPKKRIVCISGDGSILMNIQELATLAELGLNVTIVIMNNGHLGLVRQQQEFFYGKKYIASKFLAKHSFKKIAQAFGMRSFELGSGEKVHLILKKALKAKGPSLVDISIHHACNVTPMVKPGRSNIEMIGGSYE
ncbi:MAG: biosynthetic-type acetolactate synthase large subunit [Candidatus Omnitrophica bacterium]|jgi:acetolactate synthase-1/2/3 large subunit|nr:biosynthetic-type acetolactate synthase large subunit [Candidatus Omnitrophota bacterium]